MYVAAVDHAVARMKGGFPLCNRLLREVHGVLLAEGRGSSKEPGNFRRSQNWIGGQTPALAAFVPPPADQVEPCMAQLERFLNNDPARTPPIIKAALAHVQFETIHPFLDGNGRVGRLLMSLAFCADGLLDEPILFLSLYFKSHRQTYYDLLQSVRTDGNWAGWLEFFARAVRETADQCTETAVSTNRIAQADRTKIQGLRRIAGSAMMVHQALLAHPLTTIARVSKSTGLVPNTVKKVLEALSEAGHRERDHGEATRQAVRLWRIAGHHGGGHQALVSHSQGSRKNGEGPESWSGCSYGNEVRAPLPLRRWQSMPPTV